MDKRRLKTVYIILFFALLLVTSSMVLPLYLKGGTNVVWSKVWLIITHVGDVNGVLVLLAILSGAVVARKKVRKKILAGIFLFVFMGAILAGVAVLNEFLFKERLKVHRPSIIYLEQQMDFDAGVMYDLKGKEERRVYLNRVFEDNDIKSVVFEEKSVCAEVIKLWKYETGYSFPSGHSVNSFLLALLASLLALWLYPNNYFWKVVIIYGGAVLIALSRVFLGVHTPFDITLGAIWGSFLGLLMIVSGVFKRFIFKLTRFGNSGMQKDR